MKILTVEDNPALGTRISRQFVPAAHVDIAETGADALDKAGSEYDVIILDLGLPDMPGLNVCQRVRSAGIETPILVLSAQADVASRVSLLNAGADDYLTKPFHGDELRARIRALMRRKPSAFTRDLMTYKDLTLNRENRTAARNGVPITLTRKEFDILEYLVVNTGHALTRMMIFDHVWHEDAKNEHNVVDVHIKRLRDKIDRPFALPLIHTVHGLGYVVDVR